MATNSAGDKFALGSIIAGGAIAAALIETLFDKGTLTLVQNCPRSRLAECQLPSSSRRRS